MVNWLGTAIVPDEDNHCECFRKQWGVQSAIFYKVACHWASQVPLVVKNWPTSAGDIRDAGSIPGPGRSPGGGPGNPLQCSCLENPMDRGAWRAADLRVAQSQTRLKRLSTHAHSIPKGFLSDFQIISNPWFKISWVMVPICKASITFLWSQATEKGNYHLLFPWNLSKLSPLVTMKQREVKQWIENPRNRHIKSHPITEPPPAAFLICFLLFIMPKKLLHISQ